MIRGSGVSVDLGNTRIVDDVSLEIANHSKVGLVGPNGSGKTTLLRALYGSLPLAAGKVTIDDRQLGDYARKELARKISVVIQEPPSDITMTVSESVLLGRLPHLGLLGSAGEEDRRVALQALGAVDMLELAHRSSGNLSGGERQRVLVARALAQEADHIFLDEPTNHLDLRFQHEILTVVRRIPNAALMVLHDLNLAARYCDHLILLNRGRIVAAGSPEEVLTIENVEHVYQISAQRVSVDGHLHLAFGLPPLAAVS